MRFSFLRLRFHFLAQAPLRFPQGEFGNILRGAFGSVFRHIACVPQCHDANDCERRASCAYARTFEPKATYEGPSGFSDHPRPFVFRTSHQNDRTIPPGSPFHFDLHLFDLHHATIAHFLLAFAHLGREGLGPGRWRSTLTSVEQLDIAGAPLLGIFDGESIANLSQVVPSSLSLDPQSEPVRRVQVHFLTPTELKSRDQLTTHPEFGILLARIRDRLSTLSALYGPGPLEMDFGAFGRRAAGILLTQCDLNHVEVIRRSTRTGQRHPLGGFIGVAKYEGCLAEFVPFLTAGQFTGVGRQTTWGKGEFVVQILK